MLIQHGVIAQHLRVDQANLDDAFVALTQHGQHGQPGHAQPRPAAQPDDARKG